jgi:hypothetical protein
MALYRLEMQNVSRANGVSSVAKAAYRHRSVMVDNRTGEIHGEKSANRDDLVYAEILAPDNTPDFLIKSSNDLWNLLKKQRRERTQEPQKNLK